MVEGNLVKIREEVGEGVVSVFTVSPGLTLGEGANAVKKAVIRLPPTRPRGSQVKFSYLAVGVLAPPHVRAPLRWRMELDGVTVAREMKPQTSVEMEDSYLYRAMYDTSPILSAKKNSFYGCQLKFSYDSAHPITLVETSMVNGFTVPKASYSMKYLAGHLVLEPGESVSLPIGLSKLVGEDTSVTVTVLVGSPRAVLRIRAGESAEVSGPGLRAVELPAGKATEVKIEYPAQEVKIYPKKAVVTGVTVVNRSLPVPLEVRVGEVGREGSTRTIELLLHNPGEEPAEEVTLAVKQSMVLLKEVRLEPLGPRESARFTLSLDVARLPSRSNRVTVEVRWVKDSISSSRSVDVDL